MFGKDVVITEGGKVIGTKHINEYGDASESELADDPDLDVDTREFFNADKRTKIVYDGYYYRFLKSNGEKLLLYQILVQKMSFIHVFASNHKSFRI